MKEFETTEKCSKCGGNYVFKKIERGGTTVKFARGMTEIIRNAPMPFVWVLFKCEKCGWALCAYSTSKTVREKKREK